jgi:hypothetical protein
MENDIPTALEFFIKQKTYTNIEQFMIEFAKLHVEAALKQASEQAKVKVKQGELGAFDMRPSVKKKSIINAYPLTNIK